MSEELVTLTIDGVTVRTAPGTLLVEAAAQAGILIPVYCYHPKLAPVGACRMCLVEVEGAPKLIASCTTPVREGMVVYTDNQRVRKAREGILEFLLVHHPLDCPVCDKGGECPLQDFTYQFGPSRSRFRYPKRHWDKPLQIGPNILLDRERCIMCFRCVRFCEEISHHRQLGVFQRGNNQEIGTFPGQPFDSRFAGNTIELCPVGALTGAPTRFFGRTWEIGHTPSVCTGCSTGCNIRVDSRHGSEVVRLWSRENPATDDGWLCDPGRFGYGFVNDGRLEEPLVESDGQCVPATWQQAIARAGAVLEQHAKAGTLGILTSPRMTSEELFSVSKLARTVLKVPHLDHTARYVHPAAVDLRAFAASAGFTPGTLRDIQDARQIITIGVDLSREQPVTDLRVKKAVTQKGAELVVVDAEELELSAFARHTVLWQPGDEAATVMSLANAVASPSEANGMQAVGELLRQEGPKVVLLGWRVGESPDAERIGESLAALAQALGPGTRCVTILRHCNSRGALDLGVHPAEDPVSGRGMSGEEMLRAACEGRIRALWLLGEEPLQDADPDLVRRAMENLEALVFQGWSLPSWLERVPDAALPSTTFAEMDGTFTNTHGRVQRIFRAIRPKGKSRPGWEIVNDLAQALGHPFDSRTVEAVFEEMCAATPAYRGLSWNSLGVAGRESQADSAAAAPAAAQG